MTGEDHLQRVAECRDMGGYLIGRQPGGHLHRERNQQHDIADHCRVEGVMAQASVQLLGNDYGKGSAEHHHPPRGQWRNTHRQQQAGEQGGIIFQRGSNRLFTQFENSGFGRPGRQGGEDNLQYGAPAEKPGLDHNARHSGEQHQQHNTRGLPLVMGIGELAILKTIYSSLTACCVALRA